MSRLNIRHLFRYVKKSKFIRTIFIDIVVIFLVVILLTLTILTLTFNSSINKNNIAEQGKRLKVIEDNISGRMDEVTSVAYNVGNDKMFYIEPINNGDYTGYEMVDALSRYLVGNRFIKQLSFYRLSEPNSIYTSNGELTINRFWDSYLECDNYTQETFLNEIKGLNGVELLTLKKDEVITSFLYVCPLPQFSVEPMAFVFALIPYEEISQPLSMQLLNKDGAVAVYDAQNRLVYSEATSDDKDIAAILENCTKYKENNKEVKENGYIIQTVISDLNAWTYISVMEPMGIIGNLDFQQLTIIIALVLLMIIAILIILLEIINNYKPINNLAMALSSTKSTSKGAVDEKSLISDTIDSLRIESEQKQQFENAFYQANEASKAKSIFLSNMSHDIRTPMNAVIGMIALAQKHINEKEYVDDCLKKADVASHYLLELINNVLDMSRIESGKIVISEEQFSLPDIIYGLITITNSNMGGKKQQFIVDADNITDEVVWGDGLRLSQVFMNILSNAIKYTPEGGKIRMQISQNKIDDEYSEYSFRVIDSGIGMSAEFVKHVFDSFVRETKSGISKIEGTGLGMAIAKNLVDMMGGTITCQSEIDKGTTFEVRLKLKTVSQEKKELEISENTAILIYCPDLDICKHQTEMFQRIGFEASSSTTMDDVKELLREARKENNSYKYVLINLMFDVGEIDIFSDLLANEIDNNTKTIITAAEFSVIADANLFDAQKSIFMRTPLFISTIINTLSNNKRREAEQVEDNTNYDLTSKRVLLAEDNEMNRLIANKIMSEVGVEVIEAKNGKEAVEQFANNPANYFDVILMDVQMPEMDGIMATKTIRSMQRADAKEIRIYAMTANTFDEDVKEVLRAGMNGHIAKPYSQEELYRAIRKGITK